MNKYLLFVERGELESVKDEAASVRLHEIIRFQIITDRRKIRVELGGDRDQYLLITKK